MGDKKRADELTGLDGEDQRLLLLAQVMSKSEPLEVLLAMVSDAIAAAMDVPVVLVSLVDTEQQHFLAQTGLPEWAQKGTPISHSFCRQVVITQEPMVVESATEDARVAGNPAIADLEVLAYLGQPIEVLGRVLGSLCAISHVPRSWTEQELVTLRRFADVVQFVIEARLDTQSALAMERATASDRAERDANQIGELEQVTDEQDRVEALSRRFQRALMPRSTSPRDVAVDVLYEPGSARLMLGGDFADTALGRDGDLHFVLGDVMGHGPEAAALAISLRASWNALQSFGADLDAIMAELDKQALGADLCATVLMGAVADGRLSLISAGHPLPILASGGEAEELLARTGPMLGLGVSSPVWPVADVTLGDQTVLAYTDGLIEGLVNGTRERFGEPRLLSLIRASGSDPRMLWEAVTRANRGPLPDDVAILRIRPTAAR